MALAPADGSPSKFAREEEGRESQVLGKKNYGSHPGWTAGKTRERRLRGGKIVLKNHPNVDAIGGLTGRKRGEGKERENLLLTR